MPEVPRVRSSQALSGEKLGQLLQLSFTLVVGLSLMFALGDWAVSLVVLGALPLMGVAMTLQVTLLAGGKVGDENKVGDEKTEGTGRRAAASRSAGALISEVVLGIRTAACFPRQDTGSGVSRLHSRGWLWTGRFLHSGAQAVRRVQRHRAVGLAAGDAVVKVEGNQTSKVGTRVHALATSGRRCGLTSPRRRGRPCGATGRSPS